MVTVTKQQWQQWQRQDEDGKTATAMKKKEASSWFSYYFYSSTYLCPFFNYFAELLLKNQIFSWSVRFKGHFNPILKFLVFYFFNNFFKLFFFLFTFKVPQLGDWNAIHLFKLGNVSPQKQIIPERTTFFESLVWLVLSLSLLTSYPESLTLYKCIACIALVEPAGGGGNELSQAKPGGLFFYIQTVHYRNRGGWSGGLSPSLPPPSPHL